MMIPRQRRFAFSLCLLFLFILIVIPLKLAIAALEPHYTLRELAFRGQVIVITVPLGSPHKNTENLGRDQATPCKVLEVLKGSGVNAGDIIFVQGISYYLHKWPPILSSTGKPEEYPDIVKGLLFLEPLADTGKKQTFWLVSSGIRYLTKDQRILSPYQFDNPGPSYLVATSHRAVRVFFNPPPEELDWVRMIDKVRQEIKAVGNVTGLKEIEEPLDQNRRIFEWINNHRKEFTSVNVGYHVYESNGAGWGSLEYVTLDWIMESRVFEDCWQAIKLFYELHPDGSMDSEFTSFSFATKEGREFLLQIIQDKQLSFVYLKRALLQLDNSLVLGWVSKALLDLNKVDTSHVVPANMREREAVIKKVAPFLGSSEFEIRKAALNVLNEASCPVEDGPSYLCTRKALPVLIEAHKKEPAGRLREYMQEVIHRVSGGGRITQSQREITVTTEDFLHEQDCISFVLHMTPFHERVYEEPVIVLRSQTTDGSGSEEKTIPFTVIPQVMLKQDGISTLELKRTLVRFSITDLSPGIWSLSAAGTVGYGDEKATWVAEPISFEVFDKSTLPYIFREYLNIWILCGLLAASTVVVLMWLRLRRRG